ncbi:fungal-specific transcription factor domain-containing protein [Bisporella sp. PMI_857]|nr:fungal-specific transcription factor domain-containing protein [Bisporella sp. PMI_857]
MSSILELNATQRDSEHLNLSPISEFNAGAAAASAIKDVIQISGPAQSKRRRRRGAMSLFMEYHVQIVSMTKFSALANQKVIPPLELIMSSSEDGVRSRGMNSSASKQAFAPSQIQEHTSHKSIQKNTIIRSATGFQYLPPPVYLGISLLEIFTPFPPHIGEREARYLRSHDALTLPQAEFREQLLKAYIEFVHGHLPVIDLEDFLTVVEYSGLKTAFNNMTRKSTTHQISFLLFQAVMFAAVGYVSTEVLQKEGFMSRESAKKIFFNRAKILYDFDICFDRLTTIQSLLLMTLCPTNRTSNRVIKDAWYWLGLAISLAYVLGLNRDLPSQNPNPRKKRLERRIWWVTFIREHTLSSISSSILPRLPRIKREDSHIRMLSLEDFDLDKSPARYEEIDELRMRINATDCVEKAIICWCSNESLISKSLANKTTWSPSASSIHLPSIPQSPYTQCRDNVWTSEDETENSSIERSTNEKPVSLLPSGLNIESEFGDFVEYLRDSIMENE